MIRFSPCLLIAVYLFTTVGCQKNAPSNSGSSTSKPDSSASTVPATLRPDDPALISRLEKAGAVLKKSPDGRVTDVSLKGVADADALMTDLSYLEHVTSLVLADSGVTDSGLAALKSSQQALSSLDLRGCSITNASLDHLSHFTTLRALRFNGSSGATTVDDDGMASLSPLKNLRVLALDGLWVSEVGLEALGDMPVLSELYMKSSTISDDGLALLSRYPLLKKVRLAFNQISDNGLIHLAKLTNLEELDLSENSQIFDGGLVHLSGLTALRKLNLWRVPITDQGVKSLASLTNLEWLNLDNTQLSDAGLVHLQNMNKLTFLHLGSTLISDAGLSALEPLKNLKDLKVTRTSVTEAGVAQLQPLLPDTAIQLKYIEGE